MSRGAGKHLMQENTQLPLSFLMRTLDHRLLNGAPRATEALLHIKQGPELFHQRIHDFFSALMRDEHGPGLGTTNTLKNSPPQAGVPNAGHTFEQRRSRGDTHIGQHVRRAVDGARSDTTFAVDHNVVERKSIARCEEYRLGIRSLLAKSKTDPA